MDVRDKVAIVTGASYGIGLATARLLTQRCAKVALVARSKERLEQISQELPGSFVVTADMSVDEDVRQMVQTVRDHYGRIDILINNAGQGYDASTEEIDAGTFRKLIDLDVLGPLVAMQAVIPIMRRQRGGVIVNISSGLSLMYLPNMGAYSAAKRALNGLSLTARQELAADGIVVSVVYPYITNTDFQRNTIGASRFGGPGESHGDPPDYVAEKILDVINSGQA
jgi:short-subunit dehydrogenase